jgi:BASS family bile acid:Na+ symporter
MSRVTLVLPLLALLGSAAAYLEPAPWAAMKPAIVPLLGLVMFGMGMTLTLERFTEVLRRPRPVLLGLALQFAVMPLAGWMIAEALGLPAALAAGLVLVGASPGGTASNVICYLARGDVALSITLTTVSTLLAVLLTPALTWLYAGQRVPVPAGDMLVSIAQVVLAPVVFGALVNRIARGRTAPLERIFPLISVIAIAWIIAVVVALNRDTVGSVGLAVIAAVALHNAAGLTAGYWVARGLGEDAVSARTLAIEVGMQNSGLAVALAAKYFPATAALPGALFSVWHNLSGSALAAWWSRRDPDSRKAG